MYKNEKPTIMVIGGYGGVGSLLVSLLIANTDVDVVVAGRTLEKADELVERLVLQHRCSSRVSSRLVDITRSRKEDFADIDLVIHATTANRYMVPLAQAVMRGGADFIDLSLKHVLVEVEQDLLHSGKLIIAQAGFHPGLPSAFTRHLAPMFDSYNSARISMAMRAKFNSPESVNELLYAVGDWSARVCDGGVWRKAKFSDVITTNFGEPFGEQDCFPLEMVEMEDTARELGIKQAGVYVIGFNRFVDMFVFPLIMLAYKIKRGLGDSLWRKLLFFGLNRFSTGEDGVVFILDAIGKKDGKDKGVRMMSRHTNAYLFTAVPVFACVKQYLEGRLPKSGLCMMGQVVDTDELVRDMQKLGIVVSVEVRE